jgi:hypothetical protein
MRGDEKKRLNLKFNTSCWGGCKKEGREDVNGEKSARCVKGKKTRGRPDTKIMGVVNDPVLKRYGQNQHVAPGGLG